MAHYNKLYTVVLDDDRVGGEGVAIVHVEIPGALNIHEEVVDAICEARHQCGRPYTRFLMVLLGWHEPIDSYGVRCFPVRMRGGAGERRE